MDKGGRGEERRGYQGQKRRENRQGKGSGSTRVV